MSIVCFGCVFLYTLLSLSGNSGRLAWVRLQQPQEQRYRDETRLGAAESELSLQHRHLSQQHAMCRQTDFFLILCGCCFLNSSIQVFNKFIRQM